MDAFPTARRFPRGELFGGITSGANVWTALQRARALALDPGRRIVTVICVSWLKYLNGDLFAG